ncbi:MAG: aminoacyl-histidine dipeptidase [Bacteroidota bacterium]
MTKRLSGLSPQPLWEIFEELCNIPRASTKEQQVIAFIKKICEKHGAEVNVDEIGNMVIRKPATKGYEHLKGIILQGHTDMVTEKNADTKHDFDKDPILPRIENGWVKATGTTLGADNGIGIAAALAVVVSNNIGHGPIECILTANEETGQTGAFAFKPGLVQGDILLNLDSEEDGEFNVGCAGGTSTKVTLKTIFEKTENNSISFKISIKGLKGGHSGVDIHLGRGNANKIMNRFLWDAAKNYGLRIAEINGGTQRNAIPREAFAIATIPETERNNFLNDFENFSKKITAEFSKTDPDIKITAEVQALPKLILEKNIQDKFLKAIAECPNGVIAMSKDISGLVETSTNLGVIESLKDHIRIVTFQRSLVDKEKEKLNEKVETIFKNAGAIVEHYNSYPGWKPDMNSEILKVMKNVYKNLYGKFPEVKTIHAGLECSLLGSKYPHWDKISFGPTILSPHSPDERVEIKAVSKFWDLLVATLKNAPAKNN